MGSRIADSEALKKRVERLPGWEVSNGSNGWRVKAPSGRVVVIHRTYGDVASLDVVTRRLDSIGMSEAEAELERRKSRDRKLKLMKAPAVDFSDQEKLKKQQDEMNEVRRSKAAGPYQGPEDVHITWFAQAHPAPWMRWVYMTPEIATYLLREHNTANRPMKVSRVNHYRDIILRDEWHLTHQGMAMDTDGILQDGQHRLAALIAAAEQRPDLKVPVPFFVGMDARNFLAIDEGGNRTAIDLFARGGESHASAIAALIRLVIAYDSRSPRVTIRERLTNEAVINLFATDPDEIRACAKFTHSSGKRAFVAGGPLGAAMYVLRKANGKDNRYVRAFMSGLVTGLKCDTRIVLDDDDPRRVLRAHFQNARLNSRRITGLEAMSLIIMAWNNVVERRNPRYMRFTSDTPIPRITLALDDGTDQAKSAAPAALSGEIGASA